MCSIYIHPSSILKAIISSWHNYAIIMWIISEHLLEKGQRQRKVDVDRALNNSVERNLERAHSMWNCNFYITLLCWSFTQKHNFLLLLFCWFYGYNLIYYPHLLPPIITILLKPSPTFTLTWYVTTSFGCIPYFTPYGGLL